MKNPNDTSWDRTGDLPISSTQHLNHSASVVPYNTVVWKLIKVFQTHCKVCTEFIFQGPGKPLLFLIKTFRVAGVNTQSNAHMAIPQESGMLFLLSMNTTLFFYLCCDLIAQIKWKSDMVIKVLYFVYLTKVIF